MEANDENNVDGFALEILRRAKERSQAIKTKAGQNEAASQDPAIDLIMAKLERKSDASNCSVKSPEKQTVSPSKTGSRSILKPMSSNDNLDQDQLMPAPNPVKKTVTTFDAMTGDTIVEAQTFMSDGEDQEEQGDEGDMDVGLPSESDTVDGQDTRNDFGPTDRSNQGRSALKKLAQFHSSEEADSPVHPYTPLETFNHGPSEPEPSVGFVSASRKARCSRLSALAKTINDWEDDTSHLSIPGSRFHEVDNANNPRSSLAGKSRYSSASSPSAASPKSLGVNRPPIQGVRLFSSISSVNEVVKTDSCSNYVSKYGQGTQHGYAKGSPRLDFQPTIITKLNNNARKPTSDASEVQDDWDQALMKSLELQGFSRRQGSPLKQIRERSPDQAEQNEVQQPSPKKTYFGGSPSAGSPLKSSTPKAFGSSLSGSVSSLRGNLASPAKTSASSATSSPLKNPASVVSSPVRSNMSPSVVNSPVQNVASIIISRRSPSPVKPARAVSPSKGVHASSSNESTPSVKPVSAIRMRFEAAGGVSKPGPTKPERSRLKPYTVPSGNVVQSSKPAGSSSPVRKFRFGESTEKDPSSLSVAERARLFERNKFSLASPERTPTKKSVVCEVPRPPTVFTSSPCVENPKPHEIDLSVVPGPVDVDSSPKKRQAPAPPVVVACPAPHAKGPAPPPPAPPMPTASTPTNLNSKRRSTSPARSFPAENHSVKRIKVNAPKPGYMYPSLTDIETETETEAEGHCSEVETTDDSITSEQSLGTQIQTIAKAVSPIRPSGGRMPSRYRPSEDFSATFACAAVDALIDEALEGQDMTSTMNCSTTMIEVDKSSAYRDLERISEHDSASLERTVVSVNESRKSLCTDENGDSLNDTPSEPDGLEEAREVSCSEADTTASSSFTTSPVAVSSFYAQSDDAASSNVDRVRPVNLSDFSDERPDQQQRDEEPFVQRPLMHTVSFYRKQQQQQKKTDICAALNDISEHPECMEDSEDESLPEKPDIGETIRKLEDEVEGRNSAIAQASKALNWCKTLLGFSDSTEYIECERILLIESQRRLALLNSIHRLKTEGALGPKTPVVFSPSKQEVSPSCTGSMKIAEIAINLRRDYFTSHRAEYQYHFIALIKHKHQIEYTTLLTYESQKQAHLLKFPNDFSLENLDPDFQIGLEIYYLESAKEFLPHEAKYRINAKKDSKHGTLLSPHLTPSKKGHKGNSQKPTMHSPAGPDAVKSSSFKFCGGLSIDIGCLHRTYWELDKAAGPLTGGVSLKIQCSAMGGGEHKGFLTLFEDVSGYGAWVRRWCRLGPAVLEFWKYPEDETECKKPPLGTLNLHECVTSRVRPAPRDVCARANTLLLVTTRAPHPNDKDTLVTSCHKNYTAVRHLISADTREERDIWCQRLNKALANLRAWDPVAKQSVDDNLF